MKLTPDVRNEYAQALRGNFKEQTKEMTDQQLFDCIQNYYENACELEIFEYYNVYRFIALSFLPEQILTSELMQGVLIRVLNDFDLTESQRLSFIYKHIVNRNK